MVDGRVRLPLALFPFFVYCGARVFVRFVLDWFSLFDETDQRVYFVIHYSVCMLMTVEKYFVSLLYAVDSFQQCSLAVILSIVIVFVTPSLICARASVRIYNAFYKLWYLRRICCHHKKFRCTYPVLGMRQILSCFVFEYVTG